MKLTGAIFDMDGTLIDSLGLWDVLWKDFGERYCGGKTFVPDEVADRYIRTVILPEAMRFIHEHCGIGESAEELFRVADDCFVAYYKTTVQLKPGVREFLDYCMAHGVKMCIASAGEPHLINTVLDACDLRKYFLGTVSCASVGKGKDAPDVFFAARDFLGTPMEETWVFEDSVLSLDTAHKAGFHTVGIYDCHNHDPQRVRELSEIYIAEGEGIDRLIGKEF